jgi:hypothetical protein
VRSTVSAGVYLLPEPHSTGHYEYRRDSASSTIGPLYRVACIPAPPRHVGVRTKFWRPRWSNYVMPYDFLSILLTGLSDLAADGAVRHAEFGPSLGIAAGASRASKTRNALRGGSRRMDP